MGKRQQKNEPRQRLLAEKIGECVLKRVLEKENAVDFNESTAFIMVEVTGLEPAASWSQTTRATNCATPRSYNLSIIIHERCGRQVPARQKSYSQAEQPQHQQVRGVEGIEEPLVKRAPAGGAPAIVQVQDHIHHGELLGHRYTGIILVEGILL